MEKLPDGIREGSGWVLYDNRFSSRFGRETENTFGSTEGHLYPCWVWAGSRRVDLAVVQHADESFWIHHYAFEPNGDSKVFAGPFPTLIAALVVMRMNMEEHTSKDIVDLYDPTPLTQE